MKTIVENPHHGESAHGDSVQLLSYFAEVMQSHKCLSCVCITSVACSHVCGRRGEPDTTHSWRARRRKTILSRGTLRVVTMHSKRFNREWRRSDARWPRPSSQLSEPCARECTLCVPSRMSQWHDVCNEVTLSAVSALAHSSAASTYWGILARRYSFVCT